MMRGRACALVIAALAAAACSLVTSIPDLTSGAVTDAAVPPCHLQRFAYDPDGRTLRTVHVSGSFNGWPKTIDAGGWPLAETDAGWVATRDVPRGHYAYKLVLNESEWIDDPSDPKTEPDGFGGRNSVLDVVCDADR